MESVTKRTISLSLEARGEETAVVLTEKADGTKHDIGRVVHYGFQPVRDADFALTPPLLVAIAKLIDEMEG